MPQSQLIVDYVQSDIEMAWSAWQTNYIEADSINMTGDRVIADENTQVTFSEGQAYGMLFSVLMNDHLIFNRLWVYARQYLNTNGLMSWHIGRDGQRIDEGAATDADLDMAMALIYACRRVQVGDWQASFNYCDIANELINAIWVHEVDKAGSEPTAGLSNNIGFELIPGDRWCLSCDYPNGITNPSYFSPAYFPIFAEFTNRVDWHNVTNRNYDLLEQAQFLDCSRLVPNWITYDGQVQIVDWQGESSSYWGWDAARVSWRLALARYWFDDARASNVLNKIGGFFDGIGINNVRSEYRLDGRAVNNYTDTFFIAHSANAIWGMTSPTLSPCRQVNQLFNTSRQQAYNAVQARSSDGYYNDSWQLLSMLLMTGYFNHPTDPFILPRGASVSSPTQNPTTTPLVQPTSVSVEPNATNLPVIVTSEIAGMRVERRVTVNNNQQVQFQLRVVNQSQQALDRLAIRLYFEIDADRVADDYILEVYWDSTNAVVISAPQPYVGQIYYFEIGYPLILSTSSNWELHGTLHLADWLSSLDTNNDWWMRDVFDNDFAETPYLPLFMDGQLIFGANP